MAGYSQEVVVKARRGDEDHVKHAVCLFTDFPAFVIHVSLPQTPSLCQEKFKKIID